MEKRNINDPQLLREQIDERLKFIEEAITLEEFAWRYDILKSKIHSAKVSGLSETEVTRYKITLEKLQARSEKIVARNVAKITAVFAPGEGVTNLAEWKKRTVSPKVPNKYLRNVKL